MTKEQYDKYLKSFRWRVVSSVRVWLDGGRCHACMIANGERDQNNRRRWIEVHHRDYRWCNRGWVSGALNEIADTFSYCNVCHQEIHKANKIGEFLDMKSQRRYPVLLLLFVLFFVFGMTQALYGWLAVLLAVFAALYASLIVLSFYR